MFHAHLWRPLLTQVFGGDRHSQRQSDELLTQISALNEPALEVLERGVVLTWLTSAELSRQAFTLPWLCQWLFDPAAIIRQRTVTILGDLLGGAAASIAKAITGLTDVQSPKVVAEILARLERLILAQDELEPSSDEAADATLSAPTYVHGRGAIGALALLAVTCRWLRFHGSAQAVAVMEAYFSDDPDQRQQLLMRLGAWGVSGPQPVRLLVMWWVGATGCAPMIDDGDVVTDAFLLERYGADGDPLVSCGAIEAWALGAVVSGRDMEATAQWLIDELATLGHHRLSWPLVEPSVAARVVLVGIIDALVQLALQSYPDTTVLTLIERLMRIKNLNVKGNYDSYPVSFFGGTRNQRHQDRVMEAAGLLNGRGVMVEVEVERPDDRPLVNLGHGRRLRAKAPGGARAVKAGRWWAHPSFNVSNNGNKTLRLQLVRPCKKSELADVKRDLLGLWAMPALPLSSDPKRGVPGREGYTELLCSRGDWIAGLANGVAHLLCRAMEEGDSLTGGPLEPHFEWLRHVALWSSITRSPGNPNGGPAPWNVCDFTKKRMRRLFLHTLAEPAFFHALQGEGEPSWPLSRLWTELGAAVIRRATPEMRSYRWLHENRFIFEALEHCDHEGGRVAMRARLILRFDGSHRGRRPPRVMASQALPVSQALKTLRPSVCFSHGDALKDHLQRREDHARSSGGPPDRGLEMNLSCLRAERVARWIEAEREPTTYPEPQVERAAAHLLAQTAMDPLSRMRLFEAFGQRTHPMDNSSVRRLYDELMRSARASELALMLAQRRATGLILEDRSLSGWLLRIQRAPLVLSALRREQVRLDLTALTSGLHRRDVITQALASECLASPQGGPTLFSSYLALSDAQPLPGAAPAATAATGELLAATPGPDAYALVDLRPAIMAQRCLADYASEVYPAFVHKPSHGVQLTALCRHAPRSARAVDLFEDHSSLAERTRALKALLQGAGPVRLVARVVGHEEDGQARVHLGAGGPHLNATHCVAVESPPAIGEPLEVDIRWDGERQILVDVRSKTIRPSPPKGYHVADLRGSDDGDAALWALRNREPLALRATATGSQPHKNDDRVWVSLHTGFKTLYRGQERELEVLVHPEKAPEPGDEVWLLLRGTMRFSPAPPRRPTYEVRAAPQTGTRFSPGTVVPARLVSERSKRSGRRKWYAVIGDARLRVPRGELTPDLHTLFALDALADDHPTLRRLADANTPTAVAIGKDGNQASVTAAPPQWTRADLIVAVAAGAVRHITLSGGAPDGRLLFEVGRPRPENIEVDRSVIPPLGLRVRLSPQALYDQEGLSGAHHAWKKGTRLHPEVKRGHLRQDGSLEPLGPDEGDGDGMFLTYGRPDLSNREVSERFRRDDTITVKACYDHDTVSLRLGDPMPGAFPEPRIVLDSGARKAVLRQLKGSVGEGDEAEIEVRVSGPWNPYISDYSLAVGSLGKRKLSISRDRPGEDLRRLIDLRPGDVLENRRGQRRVFFEDVSGVYGFFGNMRVNLDTLTGHLFNGPLTPQVLNKPRGLPLVDGMQIVEVNHSPRRKWAPWLPRGQRLTPPLGPDEVRMGIVTETPLAQGATFGVQWLLGEPGQPEASDVMTLCRPDSADARVYLGDRVRASKRGGKTRFQYESRYITGTFLYQAMSLKDYAETRLPKEREMPAEATLVRDGSDDGTWLFVAAPGRLVRVGRQNLVGLERLKDAGARPLDRVSHTLSLGGAHSGPSFIVEEVRHGPLRRWLNNDGIKQTDPRRQLELIVDGGLRGSGLRRCRLQWPGKRPDFPTQRLRLQPEQIPGSVPLRGRSHEPASCALVDFTLDALPAGPGGRWQLELIPDLRPWGENHHIHHGLSFDLISSIKASARRVLSASGQVECKGDERWVRLPRFPDSQPVPMPIHEQSWLRYADPVAQPGHLRALQVTLDDAGRPFASVIRAEPPQLHQWIERHQLPRGETSTLELSYFGVLGTPQREVRGFEGLDFSDGTVEVLFEVDPRGRGNEGLGDYFVVSTEELLFHGEPFKSSDLQPGDRVTRFELTWVDDDDGVARPSLNILAVLPDMAVWVESFDADDGLLYAKVEVVGHTVRIAQLLGVDYRARPAGRRRQGKWTYELEIPEDQREAWLSRLSEHNLTYVKLSRIDRLRHIIVFRVLGPEEIFKAKNLLYVRADGIDEAGGTFFLRVKPLDEHLKARLSISDNVFSARRWQLLRLDEQPQGIYLARVKERRNKKQARPLSLLETPARSFGLLMHRGEPAQVVLRETDDGGRHLVELSPGVSVYIPGDRLVGDERVASLKPGDILLVQAHPRAYHLQLIHVIPSHLAYLGMERRPTVLADLWGSESYRLPQLRRGAALDSSIVGLAQLKAAASVKKVDALKTELLPMVPRRLESRNSGVVVSLYNGRGRGQWVGRLVLGDDEPRIVHASGERRRVRWHEVTAHEGHPAEIQARLKQWRWRDLLPTRPGMARATIKDSLVIAQEVEGRGMSLIARAEHPFPVDHLIEQYPFHAQKFHSSVQLKATASKRFTVARATRERLVLEVGPGRFAELPTWMLLPLHGPHLAPGLSLDVSGLHAGDSIKLALRAADHGSRTTFLPRFCMESISPGKSRELSGPYVTTLRRAASGEAILGPQGPGAFPADSLQSLLQDSPLDLSELPPRERFGALKTRFRKVGTRLVLTGVTRKPRDLGQGRYLNLVDVALRMPLPGGKMGDPASFGDRPIPQGEPAVVRILDIVTDERNRVVKVDFGIEYEAESRGLLVRGEGLNARCHSGPPERGDAVAVYRTDAGDVRVCGYEDLPFRFVPHAPDPLHLDQKSQADELFPRLLPAPGAVFWATVEGVERDGGLALSRRCQLERVTPGPGGVGRCTVMAALSQSRLLVSLMGTPHIVRAKGLCLGETAPLLPFEADLTRGAGADLEVKMAADGTLEANGVYPSPSDETFKAKLAHLSASGIIAVARGARVFIPRRRVGWFRSDAEMDEAMHEILKPGSLVQVCNIQSPPSAAYSLIHTADARREVDLLVEEGEPLLVTPQWQSQDGHTAVVSTPSGLLMELRLPDGQALSESTLAYLQHIDRRAHRIELSLSPTPRIDWDLPALRPESAVDELSPYVVLRQAEALIEALEAGEEASWLDSQTTMAARPRNLKVLLEALLSHDDAAPWRRWAHQLVVGTPFQTIWTQLAQAQVEPDSREGLEPLTRYAMGYLCLRGGRLEEARDWLVISETDERPDLDQVLCYAYTLARLGAHDEARRWMGYLVATVCANAASTLPWPLIPPARGTAVYDAEGELGASWEAQVEAGDTAALRRLVGAWQDDSPKTATLQSQRLWLLLAEGDPGERLDAMVDRFMSYQWGEELSGEAVDPRILLLAARLSFAQGKTERGWAFLRRVEGPSPLMATAHFWRAWLEGAAMPDGADPLLVAIWEARPRPEQPHYAAAQLDALLEAYRHSTLDLSFSQGAVRAVSALPETQETLEVWLGRFRAQAASRQVRERMLLSHDG